MHMNSMFLDCHRKTTFRTGEVLSYNHSSSTNFIYKGFADLKIENEARNLRYPDLSGNRALATNLINMNNVLSASIF